MKRIFYTYILSSETRVLYIGVTNDIERRLSEHRTKNRGFTNRYQCHSLVMLEEYESIVDAISREKQLKKWSRIKKDRLIRFYNPQWKNLL